MQLYLGEAEYAKAAHAAEELILSAPANPLYHIRYAEIKYSQVLPPHPPQKHQLGQTAWAGQGGGEALEIAKAHFAQAVSLNAKSGRGLYGLLLTLNALAAGKISGAKKKDLLQLAVRTSDQLLGLYANAEVPSDAPLSTCPHVHPTWVAGRRSEFGVSREGCGRPAKLLPIPTRRCDLAHLIQ